ncbi:MAG: helix-turn-helix transcriptional regulator [Pirellulaceae bacterium]|nr:helix-turn-helix transcriptional regulator [Pirellulaceae bacterium]MDP6722643.1 helix-turn-helix transcriptional regulator [Pirellulaceae bacterium]
MRTIDLLFEELDVSVEEIAERSNMPFERIEAIALGRWTPSPAERQRVAEAFGVAVGEISWGHTMDPRNIRYRRYGFDESC